VQSDDTEYDSDDQPKPKKPKPRPSKRKKRKRKTTRKPHPENAEFRASVVRAQAEEAEMNTFTLSDVGKELSFVFCQLLKAYAAEGTFEGAKVFLYNERSWLENLRRQACACGNESIAALAKRKLENA
jgi:outer membrane biosynthesis protein TonB